MARRSLPLDQEEYDILIDVLDLIPSSGQRVTDKVIGSLRTKLASIKTQTFNLPEMSLRDYFAAQAMPAILTASTKSGGEKIARMSYLLADAMLEARKR